MRLASIDSTMHWEPKRVATSVISSGRATAAVLIATLSAPERSACSTSSSDAHAAADGDRDEDLLGGAAHDVRQAVAVVEARDNVHVDELVGARRVVAPARTACGSPIDAQPLEVDALDEVRRLDVEPRDEPNVRHDLLL